MRVYLDVSCLNRPFDDQGQARVRVEAEAVSLILRRVERRVFHHVSSEMAVIEINSMPDSQRRNRVLSMLPDKSDILPLTGELIQRARQLQTMGLKPADAVHVGSAEFLRADVFLTCDDRLLKAVRRHRERVRVMVSNPLTWIEAHDKR
jgi:predicted nucleic acid-binding protein